MIRSFKRLPLRFLRSNLFIAISSVLSIMLSVSLIISIFNFNISASDNIEKEMTEMYGNIDISMNYYRESQKTIDENLIDRISKISNIKISSRIYTGEMKINKYTVYALGIDNDSVVKSRYKHTKDIKEGQVVINRELADILGANENDNLSIYEKQYRIVEILDYRINDVTVPDVIIMNRLEFKKALNKEYEADYLIFETQDKSLNEKTLNELKSIDKDLEVDIYKSVGFLGRNIKSLNSYMVVMGVLVLIMCGLFIIGNFQTFLYEYRKQFAVIRAIGGTAKQAFHIVLVQCTMINTTGVLLGIIGAFFSNSSLKGLYNNFFSLNDTELYFSWKTSIYVAALCFIVIQMLMMVPAYKIKKVLPLDIINKNETIGYKGKRRKSSAKYLIIIAVVILIVGFIRREDSSTMFLGVLAGILLIAACYNAFALAADKMLKKLLPWIKVVFGRIPFVAVKNLIPQVKKNTLIIFTISTMTIINVFGANMLDTLKANNDEYYESVYLSDIILESRFTDEPTVGHDFIQIVDGLDGVKYSSMVSWNSNLQLIDDKNSAKLSFRYGDLNVFQKENIIPKVSGSLKDKIILTSEYARKNKLKVGDKISVIKHKNTKWDYQDKKYELEIAALMDEAPIPNTEGFIDWENSQFKSDSIKFQKLYIFAEDEDTALAGLEGIKKEYPEIKFNSLKRLLSQTDQMFYQRNLIFIVAMIIIFISIIIGIMNSLISNINSKRKEFAILRTLKVSRKDMVVIIFTQVILYIMIGIFMGAILGNVLYLSLVITELGMNISINFKIVCVSIVVTLAITMIIILPFAIMLSNKKISEELRY